MRLKLWVRCVLFIIFFVMLIRFAPSVYMKIKNLTKDVVSAVNNEVDNISIFEDEEENEQVYQECMAQAYSDDDLTLELQNKIDEIDDYISSNYNMSVKYVDVNTKFTYYYLPSENYYAASTIKILDALYIYQQATLNILDLDQEVLYTQSDVYDSSKGMQNYNVGDSVSLRKLVEYAIIYSDNSAHQMLVKYIGFSTLKSYGFSLGATSTLVGGDNFGNINANDAIIYLQNIYDFINDNNTLGEELKGYLINAEENMLKYDSLEVDVAHKYGEYSYYFHDIGIVYDTYPYLIAILTTHGNDDYETIINDISQKINDLHQSFYAQRKKICSQES